MRLKADDNVDAAYRCGTIYSTMALTEALLQEWFDQGTIDNFAFAGFVEDSLAGQRLCLDIRVVFDRPSIWCCLCPTEDTQ